MCSYTLEEIGKHKTETDCWVILYGNVYDITDFMSVHSGKKFPLQVAGGDGTALFESIHPRRAKAILNSQEFKDKYLLGSVSVGVDALQRDLDIAHTVDASPRGPRDLDIAHTVAESSKLAGSKCSKFDSLFASDINSAVDEYFRNAKPRDSRGGWNEKRNVYGKFALIISLTVGARYKSLKTRKYKYSVMYAICMLAVIFNISHGANHGELVKRYPAAFSKLCQYSHHLLGASHIDWMHWHNVSHHQHTNSRLDVDSTRNYPYAPNYRYHQNEELRWYTRYQHYYTWMLYLGTYFVAFGEESINTFKLHCLVLNALSFLATRRLYFKHIFVESVVFGFLFVMINCVTHATHLAEWTEEITDDWYKHQVESSANWSTKSRVVVQLLGGINYQIEHHLFQSVHHSHYPAMSKIVRRVCADHGVRYVSNDSYFKGLYSHYKCLRQNSKTIVSYNDTLQPNAVLKSC